MIVFLGEDDERQYLYPPEFHRGFFRLAVGLEDTDDLIRDIDHALVEASAHRHFVAHCRRWPHATALSVGRETTIGTATTPRTCDTEKNNIPSTYCRLVQNVLSRSAKSPTEPLP